MYGMPQLYMLVSKANGYIGESTCHGGACQNLDVVLCI